MTPKQTILNQQFAVAVADFLKLTNVSDINVIDVSLVRETFSEILSRVNAGTDNDNSPQYKTYSDAVTTVVPSYIKILDGTILLSSEVAKRYTKPSNLYSVNTLLNTSVTMDINGSIYGLVNHQAGYGEVEIVSANSFRDELAKIESVYNDLTYREGSDPTNVKVQGILRQLLELRFAVAVYYFTCNQDKQVADVLNRIESIFSSLMDDTYSAKPLYNRIQARKPS